MHYHAGRADALARKLRPALNDARRDHDREPLEHIDALDAVAADYAETLRYADEFGHHVDGSPQQRASKFSDVRENLHRRSLGGVNADRTATATVRAWLNSPGHRATLLEPQMRLAGVGVATSTNTAYVVHVLAAGKSVGASVRETIRSVSPL